VVNNVAIFSSLISNTQADIGTDQRGFSVPLVIAVTGHRNLLDNELLVLREKARAFFSEIRADFPDRQITVMSALAKGADMLVAEEALKLDFSLTVPLPMSKQEYMRDFDSVELREKFESILAQATEVYELPLTSGNTLASITEYGEGRNQQYAQLGVFLCGHCHILLALWDGKYSDNLGGTSQVVRFHHDDVMPGYTTDTGGSGIILVDDESDLVYHIVCSRNQPNGSPEGNLKAGDHWWFSLDAKEPRSKRMPESHRRTFAYTNDFSTDALKYAGKIRDEAYALLNDKNWEELPSGLRSIDRLFCAADWLAIHFQKRVVMALRLAHLLAVLMGLMYIAYSDILPKQQFLYAFLGFFALATAIYAFGKRNSWHRKYLDYRTLAEGLRVQLYWAAAGVTSGSKSKFMHDTFLQTQDPELGWIRNVMRVAGTQCDASSYKGLSGLTFSLTNWLGGTEMGQMGYFRRKGVRCALQFQRTERLSNFALCLGVVVVACLILTSAELGEQVRDPLVVGMGIMLLFVGVRQSYSHSVADEELIRQYEFMYKIFGNARRRIDLIDNDDEKRRILRILGDAALGEHAQWILMNRERTMDGGEVFQMGQ